ncbi:MAG TPA: ATP-binding protein [Dehalococcoidia bacterium]|nr:ATP-binding protein [Dehalococcoidia bacterium]
MPERLFIVAYIALSLVDLAIGAYVYSRARAQLTNQVFAALAGSVGLWTLSVTFAHYPTTSSPLLVRSTFAAASIMVLAFLTFLRVFPATPFPRDWTYRALAMIGLLFVPLAYTGLLVSHSETGPAGLTVTYGSLYPVFGIYAVICIGLGMVAVWTKATHATGRTRLQLWYLLIGLLVPAIGIGTTNLLIPLLFSASHVGLYGPIFTLVFLALTAHALIRHRLMNVRLILSRTLSHVIALLLFGALFVTILSLGTRFLVPLLHLPLPTQAALLFLAALVLQPLMHKVRSALDRYLYRTPYDYQRTIREATRVMGSTLSLPRLVEHICDVISRTVRPETIGVYLRYLDSDGYSLASRRPAHDAAAISLPHTLSGTSPLVAELTRKRAPLLQLDGRAVDDERTVRSALEVLSRLGGEAAFPMLEGGKVEGLFVLGPKRSGDPYFDEDIDLLTTLVAQAAVAIKNAQLHHRMLLMERERRQAERLAATTALAAGIAHEIKNPLVAIKTFAELLPERFTDQEFRSDFSKVVIREIERIDELIARLRALAAPISRRSLMNLKPVLDETLALLRGRMEQAGISVSISIDDDLPPVHADQAQLKQLLLNILLNAVEAMEGGGKLSIQLRRQPEGEGEGLIVAISDTGSGIPSRLLEKIFDPFVTTKPEGSGLGLSICRSIADAHQATIKASNNAGGRGATITVQFPAASLLDRSLTSA